MLLLMVVCKVDTIDIVDMVDMVNMFDGKVDYEVNYVLYILNANS